MGLIFFRSIFRWRIIALGTFSLALFLTADSVNAGCPNNTILFYYNAGACDGTAGATGAAMSNLLARLQAISAAVTPVTVCSNTFCPGDAGEGSWSGYDQVWDARFAGGAALCSAPTMSNDYFDTCWQTTATTYLSGGGNLYLQGENSGWPGSTIGENAFLKSIGAATGGLTDCPLGATSNDYADLGAIIPSTLPGAANFFGYAVGGIPTSVSNGTNFVTYNGPWTSSGATTRSIATGWTSSQMTLGAGAGKLFMSWDTTMWTGGYYPTYKTTVDTFYDNVYQWLKTCTTPTPTPTPGAPTATFTATATNTMTATATNTAVFTATATSTFTAVNTATSTFTATVTFTPTATFTATNTPTITFTPVPPIDIFDVDKNVFNPTTDGPINIHIAYNSFPGDFWLSVYNTAGEHIYGIIPSQNMTTPVDQVYTWDGKNKLGEDCASGVYILYLIEPYSRKLKKVILVR